jgi:hypothetical protein
MKRVLRNSKLILASLVFAVGGLSVAATAAPAAHAATNPFISVTGQGGGAQVYGWQFTAGVTARVELLDSGLLHVVATQYITPWWNSTHAYGVFDTLLSTSYSGSAWVAVDQLGHATVWAKTYIYPAPHIQVTGETAGVQVNGSGFTPGATVRVEVLDTSLNVQHTQYVTAVNGGVASGTFYTALKAPCGSVYVAADGSPGPTAWAKAYVTC